MSVGARSTRKRRGVALLIVLGTLVLVVTASAALMTIASTARASRLVTTRIAMADALLVAAGRPIERWLAEDSPGVVLPADAPAPRVEVLQDTWILDETEFGLRITAFDQCGMVPLPVARGSSPVGFAIPSELRHLLDRVELRAGEPAGLDLFVPLVAGRADLRVFPVIAEDEDQERLPHEVPPTVGALIATHNESGRLNVNTAPAALIEGVMREAGRGGLDQILAAREAGEVFTPAGPPSDRARRGRRLELAGGSDAWAFLVEVRVGRPEGAAVVRRWWEVYRRTDSKWERVQRLACIE